MKKHLVIADDFTGACEIGEKYHKKGRAVEVSVSYCPSHIGTLVVDTETRNKTEEEAATCMEKLLQHIDFSGYELVVKKIDSTLRGNIGIELSVLSKYYQPDWIVFLPVFPTMGRTIEKGIVKVHGVPLLQTEFAKDPIKPVTKEYIPDFLETFFPCKVISLSYPAFHQSVMEWEKGTVLTVDIQNQQQLNQVVETLLEARKKILFVGTAAMIEGLLGAEDVTNVLSSPREEFRMASQGVAIGLVASLSEKTKMQLDYAKEKGIQMLPISMEQVWKDLDNPNAEIPSDSVILSLARDYMQEGKDFLLVSQASLDRSLYEKDLQYAKEHGIPKGLLSQKMKVYLGKLGKRLYEQQKVAGYFLTGGDTAIGLLEQMEIERVSLAGEVQNGIPMLQVATGSWKGMKLITKAGGFGEENSIWEALQTLKKEWNTTEIKEMRNRK